MAKCVQFMYDAYTPAFVNKLTNSLYDYVLLLDSFEIQDLVMTLRDLNDAGTTINQRRIKLQNTWLDILRTNYGVSRKDIDDKTFSQLVELVTGLPSQNELLNRVVFRDIPDRTKVSDSEIDFIINTINDKSNRISKTIGDKRFCFSSNDRSYYWLPQSFLP